MTTLSELNIDGRIIHILRDRSFRDILNQGNYRWYRRDVSLIDINSDRPTLN